MNTTVAALLGLTLAQPVQPPAADYYPLAARRITIPIEYRKDRSDIRQVQLFVCENGDQVWKLATSAPPTVTVDPDLLGGMVVRVDDRRFDSSLRSELDKIGRRLAERASQELISGREYTRD